MRILAVSDRILNRLYSSDIRKQYPGIDLLISCGDLPYYYLDFLTSALDAPMLYVRGNHDAGPQYRADGTIHTAVRGGEDIHKRTFIMNGLLITGFEGSMRYKQDAPLMYSDAEMYWNVYSMLPRLVYMIARYRRRLDFLVTHSPPFGIHDQQDLAHRGFRAFLFFLKVFQPRYMLHGHIHVYRNDIQRTTRYGQTQIINVYPSRLLEISTSTVY